MNCYRQDTIDFTIEDIINIVMIKTDSSWNLNNLTTDDHWILSFTVDGEADYYWDKNTYKVRKGDTTFFQEGFSRSAQSSPENPWKFIVMKFKLVELNDKTLNTLNTIPNLLPKIKPAVEQLFLESEAIWRSKGPGYRLRCKSLLYSIIYSLFQESGQFYDLASPHFTEIKQIMMLIHNNLGKNYSVKQLADDVDLSESYFRSLFKKHTGYSPVQYQNFIKISHARDLLLSGIYHVNEVADKIGIEDIYYFSRLFKKLTGINPSTLSIK